MGPEERLRKRRTFNLSGLFGENFRRFHGKKALFSSWFHSDFQICMAREAKIE
jgi:hypothetical protein